MRNLTLLLILAFFCVPILHGQQLPQYSQYSMNKFYFNPAVAGYQGFTTVNLTGREQWVGFKGTPKIHSLSLDTRFLNNSFIIKKRSVRKRKKKISRNSKVGLGALLISDINGPIRKTGFEGSYAYHNEVYNGQLSMGLSLSFFQLKVVKDGMIFSTNEDDPLITGTKNSVYIPDANIGFFYSQKNFWGGYSVKQLFKSSWQIGAKKDEKYSKSREHFFMGGYIYDFDQTYRIEPSFLLSIPEKSRAQLDVSARVTIANDYWAGLKYRTKNTIGVFGGLKYDLYYFGYTFEYSFNDLVGQTFGTHEIMLVAKFGDSARRYKWLDTY